MSGFDFSQIDSMLVVNRERVIIGGLSRWQSAMIVREIMYATFCNNRILYGLVCDGFSSLLTINIYSSRIILKSIKRATNVINNEKKYIQDDIYEII